MNDIDDTLTLNLVSYRDDHERKRKKVKHLTKRSEVNQTYHQSKERKGFTSSKKKHIELDNQERIVTEHESSSDNQTFSVSSLFGERKTPVKRKHDKDGHTQSSVEAKRLKPLTTVISSLFRHNPKIPQVKSAQIEKHKEVIFSANKFRELNLHPYMISNLEDKLQFTTMTRVQKLSIPHITEGRDVLVQSQTGSGKTLAYAVPIVQNLQSRNPKIQRSEGPYALVIVPTRELAIQSFDTFQKLVRPFTWIVPGCLMGGEKKKSEKARIRKGINILVCTPGRLLDHMQTTESLQLNHISCFIIDEADRLLDMGFEKDVAQIIEQLNKKQVEPRQTILLSATLSTGVERLAGMSLQNPVSVDVSSHEDSSKLPTDKSQIEGKDEDNFTLPEQLKQHYVIVPDKLKLVTLAAFLLWKYKSSNRGSKMIAFLSTHDSVDFLYDLLMQTFNSSQDEDDEEDETNHDINLDLFKLHGNMEQKDRTKVFSEFSEARSGILLCTDVAARGLDLPHVKWIVQYNTPGSPTDYIHRVGRTARAGTKGHALLFLTPSEVEYIKILNQQQISLEELPMDKVLQTLLPNLQLYLKRKTHEAIMPRTTEDCATALQMQFETYVQSNKTAMQLAKRAFQSFIRAYATYPANLKHIFHVKNLHLGHVAKSFALRDAPSKITGVVIKRKGNKDKTNSHQRHGPSVNRQANRHQGRRKAIMSEFASGLDTPLATFKPKKSKQKTKKKTKIDT